MGHLNLKELKELIDLVSEKGFAEFELERQGFRIRIARFQNPPPAQAQAGIASPSPRSAPAASEEALSDRDEVGATAVASETGASPAAPVEVPQREAALHTIKSPIVGTFYRATSPTSEPFVSPGDHVEPDSVVCIIEAMKLMNEIQAEVAGEIVKVFVENGQPVEYGQPLFAVRV
jgi:acetyl-CoA carboxylase biotin carboxyl carrier protein